MSLTILTALWQAAGEYGYLAIALLVLLEDFGVPVPGETVLIAAAVSAGEGRLSIVAVVAVAFLAAVTGDNLGYLLGRTAGRRLVTRYGRYVFITPRRLARAEEFVGRHGAKVVIVARFIEGLRQLNGIVAGGAGMPWRRFLLCNAIGAALWVGVWASVGYLAGNHLVAVEAALRRYQWFAIAGLVLLVAGYAAFHLARRRRARHRDPR
ncbi:DedA family protein [Sphaerisporangium melleum]|uniref:DedA family protein n=1 Tax=Sphaerisporangium melleum TaxID=321316 RepID=UPI001E2CD21A|nr:DedA family protein [Sphaerisporangium melleum]